MSNATKLLSLINNSILNDDLDRLQELLNLLPIQTLKIKVSNNLLHNYLSTCALNDRIEAGTILLDIWSGNENIDNTISKNVVSLYTSLYMIPSYNETLLMFCAKLRPLYDFIKCIDELSYLNNNPNIYPACYKLLKVYGEQTLKTYKMLKENINETKYVINDFLSDRIVKINDYAKIPDYMISQDIIPKESSLDLSLLSQNINTNILQSLDIMANEIINSMVDVGFEIEDHQILLEKLIIILAISPLEVKLQMLTDVFSFNLEELSNQIKIDNTNFMLFGPVNPYYSLNNLSDTDLNNPRMLLIGKYDYDNNELEDTKYNDWFTGSCEKCEKRIRRRWHALRRPVPYGGWKGCFCSWKCIRLYLDENMEDPDLDYILVNTFENQLPDIKGDNFIGSGILDRIPDDEYDYYLKSINKFVKYQEDEIKLTELINEKNKNYIKKDQTIENKLNMSSENIVIDIDHQEIFDELMNISKIKPVVIDYYADWCAPCKKISPYFHELSSTYDNITFGRLNIDNFPKITKTQYISSMPTFIMYKNGQQVERVEGASTTRLHNLVLHQIK